MWCLESLAPLGSEYLGTLEEGLRGRWSDRYPNRENKAAHSRVGLMMATHIF